MGWRASGCAVAIVTAWAVATQAHEAASGWSYDISCCSDRDCQAVPSGMVRATPDGWLVQIPPGVHLTAPDGFEAIVPWDSPQIRPAQDGMFHPCIAPAAGSHRPAPVLLCLYVPEMGA